MNMGKLGLITISDLKTIDLVELQLNEKGQFVSLEGDNGVGKSTVMEGIEVLFNGGKLPEGLIRDGKKEAIIEAAFSKGYVAKRRIRKKKTGEQVATLSLTDPTGAPVDAPAQVLKDLFAGFLTPARVANSTGATLYNEVRSMLPIDIEKEEKALAAYKGEVTEARVELKMVGFMEKPAEPKPEVPPFDYDTFNELGDAITDMNNLHQEQVSRKRKSLDLEERIENGRLLLNQLMEQHVSLKKEIDAAQESLKTLPIIQDEYSRMKEARGLNAHAADILGEWEHYEDWIKNHDHSENKYNSLLKRQKEAERGIKKVFAEAIGPGGVEVTEDRLVLVNKRQWETLAYSERMNVAALLQIAALPEEKLPLMFIEHGEAMNSEKRMEIAKAAIDAGATVFMEIMKEDIKELKIISETVVAPGWEKKLQDPNR
jgi:hypothetical protein